MAAAIAIRTPAGEDVLDLEEFEARVERGEIDPATLVRFPPVTGPSWVRAGELELFRGLYQPKALYFSRAFHLGRIPLITLLVTVANVAVFLLELGDHGAVDVEGMVAWGAKAGPLIVDLGQLWRLFTANFVHRDWLHIGFNLFVLFHFGAALENAFRPLDYLCILVATALGTTLLSFAMSDDVSAGASGMAYGMLGGAVVFGLKYRRILPERYRRVLGGAVVPTVLVFLYIGWTSTGIDNWGHLGGLVAGAVAAALFAPRLLGDPPRLGVLLGTRVAPLAAVAAVLLFGGEVLASRLPPMRLVEDDRFGLTALVPSQWRRGADRLGPMTFYNGLSGPARASISATAHAVDEPPDLPGEAHAFVAEELYGEEEAGRIRELHVRPLRYEHVGGMLGVAVEATFEADGSRAHLTSHFFSRGGLVYSLVLVRPEGLPAYGEVLERIVRSVRPSEPSFLRAARARALLRPRDPDELLALAEAERRAGAQAHAREALSLAAALAPERAEPHTRLAALAFEEGLPREGCAAASRAQRRAPEDAYVLEAVADCALSRGDPATAAARLAEAVARAPDDLLLRAKLERTRTAAKEGPWSSER